MTKTLSRGIKSAWRERRVAANAGEPPTTWFPRPVAWLDGRAGASSALRLVLAKRAVLQASINIDLEDHNMA